MRVGEAGEGEAALRRGVDGVEEGSHPLLGPRRGHLGPSTPQCESPRVWASPVTAASVHPPRPSQRRAPPGLSGAVLQGARVRLCAFPTHGLSSTLLGPCGLRSIGAVVGEFTGDAQPPTPQGQSPPWGSSDAKDSFLRAPAP